MKTLPRKQNSCKAIRFDMQQGFSLVEAVIGIGLVGVMALMMASLMANQAKSINYLETRLLRADIQAAFLGQVLNEPNNCKCLFRGTASFPEAGAATLTGADPNALGTYKFTTPGDCSTASLPQPLITKVGNGTMQLVNAQLVSVVPISTGNYKGQLSVKLKSLKSTLGPAIMAPLNFDVAINTTPPSGGRVEFISCGTASASASASFSVDPNDADCEEKRICPMWNSSRAAMNCPAGKVVVGTWPEVWANDWRHEDCWGAGDADEPSRWIRCCPLR